MPSPRYDNFEWAIFVIFFAKKCQWDLIEKFWGGHNPNNLTQGLVRLFMTRSALVPPSSLLQSLELARIWNINRYYEFGTRWTCAVTTCAVSLIHHALTNKVQIPVQLYKQPFNWFSECNCAFVKLFEVVSVTSSDQSCVTSHRFAEKHIFCSVHIRSKVDFWQVWKQKPPLLAFYFKTIAWHLAMFSNAVAILQVSYCLWISTQKEGIFCQKQRCGT